MKTDRVLSMTLIMVHFFALYCNYATLDGIKRFIGINWYYISMIEMLCLFAFLFSCFFHYKGIFYIHCIGKELIICKALYELYFYKEQIKSKTFYFMVVLYDILIFISLLFDIILYSTNSKEKKNNKANIEGTPLEDKNPDSTLL